MFAWSYTPRSAVGMLRQPHRSHMQSEQAARQLQVQVQAQLEAQIEQLEGELQRCLAAKMLAEARARDAEQV